MSARAALSALSLTALLALAVPPAADAGPWLPPPGDHYSEIRGSLWAADSYFDENGDRSRSTLRTQNVGTTFYNELGWKKNLSAVIAVPFESYTLSDRSVNQDRTSTGLSNLLFGLRWGLQQGGSALALELDWQAPLGYDRRESLLGGLTGGLPQLSGSLLFGRGFGRSVFLQAGAGYAYRFLSIVPKQDTPPAETTRMTVPLSADLGWWIGRSLLIGGRYQGQVTAGHGELLPPQDVHLVGPVLVWRVDERLDLQAGTLTTAVGKSYPHFDQAYVAIAFKQTRLNRLQGFLGGSKNP